MGSKRSLHVRLRFCVPRQMERSWVKRLIEMDMNVIIKY